MDYLLKNKLGGTFQFPGTILKVNRMGYGAMQLAGPGVYGPPADMDKAVAVLRRAVEQGVNHIDTSDFYGPHITNQIIRKALHPYKDDLVIVSKIGARRPEDKSWVRALSKDEIIAGVQDNLRNLQLEAIDIVNLRLGGLMEPVEESVMEPLQVLVDLKKQGLIKHIGLSNVSAAQIKEAQTITDIVCVQNCYNIAHRQDDELIDSLEAQGIPYVPYFPLGGFTPLQSNTMNEVAAKLGAKPMQVALAWLLQRSKNMLLIPGTGSIEHLQENIDAASLSLSEEVLAELNTIAQKGDK